MAKGYVTLPVGYKRVDNEPLEANILFTSMDAANTYATTDPTAYVGQVITVVEGTNVKVLVIDHDKSLKELAASSGISDDYNNLTNKPQIAGVELSGNKSLEDLGIQAAGDYATKGEIPTNVSQLTNDSKYQTEDQVNQTVTSKIESLGSIFTLKGRVDNFEALPSSDQKAGDVYLVGLSEAPEMEEYVWTTEGKWEKFGIATEIDLSEYLKTTDADSKYAAKSDGITAEERAKVAVIKTDGAADEYLAADGTYKRIEVSQGTTDYNDLTNKPAINGVELSSETTEDNLNLTSNAVKLKTQIVVAGGAIGDIKDGETLEVGTAVELILNRMLRKRIAATYTKPTLTLTGTGTTDVECGTSQDIVLTPNFVKNDAGEITSISIKKGEEEIGTSNEAVTQNGFVAQEGANVFSCDVNYGDGPIKNDNFGDASPTGQIKAGKLTANKTYNGKRMTFYDFSDNDIDVASSTAVRALKSTKLGAQNNTQIDIVVTQGTKCIAFAYPASLGDVESVMQQGTNLDVKGSFVKSTVSVEGANAYTAVDYNVYKYLAMAPLNADTFKITI